MSDAPTIAEQAGRKPLPERMKVNPDGLLEQIARDYGVTTFEVVRHLPGEHCAVAPGEKLADVLEDLTGWGPVLFIVHTTSIVAEIKAAIPPAQRMRGYFNFHGEGPFGGHLKEDACSHIAFIDRPFMGRRSLSIQFFDADGAAIFKIFVARDANGELNPAQESMFAKLRERS